MNVYSITFKTADGKIVTGELITDVSLANQLWTIVPAGNGTEYSGFPAGNPPQPAWANIPNRLSQNASVSVNILTTYVTPTSGVTLALVGSLPSGWAFNTGTNILSYDGTTVSGPASVSFIATLTSSGLTSQSNTFSVSGIGSASSDVTAPTVPVGIAATSITATGAVLSGLPSSDPSPGSATWSGMKQYNVTIPGVTGSPFTVNAPTTGNQPILTQTTIGTGTSTISQSGANLTVTTTAVDNPFPTASSIAGGYQQLTGTIWLIACKISAFTSVAAFDNLRVEARTALTAASPYVAVLTGPLSGGQGISSEARASSGAATAGIASAPAPGAPLWLFIQRSGDTYSFFYSIDGNTLIAVGSTTQAMGSTLYVMAGANTTAGGPITAQTIQQINIQTDPNWSLSLAGLLTAGTTYTASVTAQDVAGNISAAGSYSFTATSAGLAMPVSFLRAIDGSQPTNYSNPAWRALAAKINLVEYQWFPGLEGAMSGGQTIASSMADVKSRAAALGNNYCKTGFYTIEDELFESGGSNTDTRTGLSAAALAARWYLYSTGWPSGPFSNSNWVIDSGFGAAVMNRTNSTPNGTGVYAGLNFMQACALYYVSCLVNGTGSSVNQSNGGAANSHIDFIDHDNQFYRTRFTGEWLCTSTSYGSGNATVSPRLQQGYRQLLDAWRTRAPTIDQGGNCDWLNTIGAFLDPSMANQYDLIFWETPFANQFAFATFFRPSQMLSQMAWAEQNLLSTKPTAIAIINHNGGPCDGVNWPTSQSSWTGTFTQSSTSPSNSGAAVHQTGTYWQAARNSLARALLRGWAHQLIGGSDNVPYYMDEYNKSGSAYNWLGPPIDPPQTVPWSQGVYRRRYTNGIVYDNPIGNGPQTLSVSGHNLAYNGFSDPAINNGASFSSLTLADADGRVTLP